MLILNYSGNSCAIKLNFFTPSKENFASFFLNLNLLTIWFNQTITTYFINNAITLSDEENILLNFTRKATKVQEQIE